MAAGGIAAGALAVLIGLYAAGVLRFGAMGPRGDLRAPATPVASALTDVAKPPSAPVQAPAVNITMPDAVRKWLEHLERIEKKKNELHQRQADEAVAMIPAIKGGGLDLDTLKQILDPDSGMPDPRNKVDEMLRSMAAPWRDLRMEFLETGPPMPAECAPLAKRFEEGLTAVPDEMDAIRKLLTGFDPASESVRSDAADSQAKLRGIDKTHKGAVDNEFLAADSLLSQICDKYRTRKWFGIDGGTLRGSPFLGGL